MNTRAFWVAALERAVRTFAQAVLGVIVTDATGVLDADWVEALSVGGLAAVAALLTAVAAVGGPEGPGLTETVVRRR